ncbi:NTP transferase domain-containing protein [bacterium]|nr:NTP transferase domain-containing protein [bacterium]
MQNNIKAMVMAAGMGSRLEPITLMMPKPLIPVMNKPIMDIILSQLKSFGITDVISNTYYLSEQIIDRYQDNDLGINFNYIVEKELSGTAGGVKKCQFFFDEGEDFVIMSGDVLTNANILKGIEAHRKSGAVATIGIKQIPHENVSHFGVVVTDNNGFITEFQEKPSIEEAKSNFINTGIYIFNYKIFDYIPENTFYDFAKNVFPKLLAEREINTFEVDEYWNDIGTIDQYKQSVKDVFNGQCLVSGIEAEIFGNKSYICGNSELNDTLSISGISVIGNNCKFGSNVKLEDCIVFDNSEIHDGAELTDCIIIPDSKLVRKSSEKRDVILV